MHILRSTALCNVEEVTNGRSGGGLYYYNAESRGHIISWPLEGDRADPGKFPTSNPIQNLENPFLSSYFYHGQYLQEWIMFLETPFQARFGGIWVWGSIRSGIKVVVDFRSQNFAIFSAILDGNMQESPNPET